MAVTEYVTGYQHVGIPTEDMEKTKEFYTKLGFEVAYETTNNGNPVRFFRFGEIIMETYEKEGGSAKVRGAIDHVALAVTDIEKTTALLKEQGFKIVEGPCSLPFWENGVRYVCIEGPNMEIIEFLQKY